MNRFIHPIAAACAVLASALAQAATPLAPPAPAVPSEEEWPMLVSAVVDDAMSSVMAGFDDASFDFAADELGGERVVKGAPYCADAVHESIQALTDGNRIVRKQQSRLCRDGEGRTRQEVERNGRKLVWLRDPVGKQAWLLDPARKTARRVGAHGRAMGFNSAMDAANAEAWREYAERAREQGRAMAERAREQARVARDQARELGRERGASGAALAVPAVPAVPPIPPVPPAPVIVTRGAQGDKAMDVQIVRLGEDGKFANAPGDFRFEMPAPPPAIRWHAMHSAPRGQGTTSALGSKDIEGLRSHGERTSWTIEAGKVGNEKAIVITREVWTSPDLLLTVLSRDADPRSGETVYRLANVKRGEPDASLMKVPSDYASGDGGAASAPSAAPAPRKPESTPKKG